MAIRVRKLARELDLSSDDVLELLRSLGFDRFRSEDDMVSDLIVERVRRSKPAARSAAAAKRPPVAPEPPPRAAEPQRASARQPHAPSGDLDLMAQLVPGVVQQRGGATRVFPRPTVTVSVVAPPAPTEAEVQGVQERRAAVAERAAFAARADELARREAALTERETGLDEREARQEEREAGWTLEGSLLGLLEERGLRGVDEAERAVAMLASVHAFGRLLGQLVPADPEAVRRVLADRLVLAGPGIEGLGLPSVTVSEDRADLPSGERVARALRAIGERVLLEGRRRLLLTGLPPRWQPLVRAGLDRRIDVTFRPGGVRDGTVAADDTTQFDLAVLWNTELTGTAREVWKASRSRLVEIEADSFTAWLDRLPALLSDGR